MGEYTTGDGTGTSYQIGWIDRTKGQRKQGKHNREVTVGPSETYDATGSRAGVSGFLVVSSSHVTMSLSSGGEIRGADVDVKSQYDFGVSKAEVGTVGIVKLLYSE